MPIFVCNCQHCDEQFQTLSCVHYTIFSVVKLDLFIRALLLDRILPLEKTTRTPRVHLVHHIPADLQVDVYTCSYQDNIALETKGFCKKLLNNNAPFFHY